jgi:hypothetical protein
MSCVQRLALLLVIAIAANAAPLPGPTGYANQGTPAFFQGAWKAIDDSAFFTSIPGQGSVTQILPQNSTSVVTAVTAYDSYECLNPNVFRIEGTITYLPSKLSGRFCALVFSNGTNLVTKVASVLAGTCPDSVLTPPTTGEVLGAYTQVLDIVPLPNVTICTTPGVPNLTAFAPPPPLSTSPPPPIVQSPPSPKTIPSKVNLLPYPGSAQPQYGLWGAPGVFMYHSQDSMCATRYEDGVLKLQIAQFSSYQCTGVDSFYQTFNLTQYNAIDLANPISMSICLSGARDNVANTLTVFMTFFGPCPAAVENGPSSPGVIEILKSTLISSIPGNPNITCQNVLPPPTPSPPVSPSPGKASCTWKGTWRISTPLVPCKNQRFSFKPSACANTNVTLRRSQQLGPNANQQSTFGLDHSWTSSTGAKSNEIVALRDVACRPNELTGPVGGTTSRYLGLSRFGLQWSIVPVQNDCTTVNLVSASGRDKGKFLQVLKCESFSWGTKDEPRTRFRLSKVSELLD